MEEAPGPLVLKVVEPVNLFGERGAVIVPHSLNGTCDFLGCATQGACRFQMCFLVEPLVPGRGTKDLLGIDENAAGRQDGPDPRKQVALFGIVQVVNRQSRNYGLKRSRRQGPGEQLDCGHGMPGCQAQLSARQHFG